MRYLLTICYDGSDFFGFQRQKDLLTIQGELEKVLSTILQEDIQIVSSGRTDAKVHALGQVAHFDTSKEIKDLDKFVYSVNSMINKAISIFSILGSTFIQSTFAFSNIYLDAFVESVCAYLSSK